MSLARLTQLFLEGTEVVLETPDGSAKIPVYVAKLNAFEEEEANQQGRIARARRVNSHRELHTPEWEMLQERRRNVASLQMIEEILVSREPRLFTKVLADVRSDDDWRERMEVIEFSDLSTLDADGIALVQQYQADLQRELIHRQNEATAELRTELIDLPRNALEDHYEEAWLEQRGFDAYGDERARQQLYLAMRTCVAEPPADGEKWDHGSCDHQQLFLASAGEVSRLPQYVRDKVEAAYASVAVSPSLARFTDALASSSASPEHSAQEEASTPSGPEGTSGEPVTT